MPNTTLPNGCTTDELRADLAKYLEKGGRYDLAFTPDTVMALLDALEQAQASADAMRSMSDRGAAMLIDAQKTIERQASAIKDAIGVAVQYGGIDGSHHKNWVIDQMARDLAGDNYDKVVADAKSGEDGPDTYSWDCGIAP